MPDLRFYSSRQAFFICPVSAIEILVEDCMLGHEYVSTFCRGCPVESVILDKLLMQRALAPGDWDEPNALKNPPFCEDQMLTESSKHRFHPST